MKIKKKVYFIVPVGLCAPPVEANRLGIVFSFSSSSFFILLCALLFTHFGDTKEADFLGPSYFDPTSTGRNVKFFLFYFIYLLKLCFVKVCLLTLFLVVERNSQNLHEYRTPTCFTSTCFLKDILSTTEYSHLSQLYFIFS